MSIPQRGWANEQMDTEMRDNRGGTGIVIFYAPGKANKGVWFYLNGNRRVYRQYPRWMRDGN